MQVCGINVPITPVLLFVVVVVVLLLVTVVVVSEVFAGVVWVVTLVVAPLDDVVVGLFCANIFTDNTKKIAIFSFNIIRRKK